MHFHQTCTITPQGTQTKWHAATPGAGVTVACRYVVEQKQVRMPDGELRISEARVTVAGDTAAALGSTVALSGDSRQYRVMLIREARGLAGAVTSKTLYLE